MKEYYALLGIEPDATAKEIKKNYRLLANKFHPDKNSDSDAATKFIAITEAYDTLSNRKKRAQYDLMRSEVVKQNKQNEDAFRTVVPPRESTRTRRNKAQQKRSINYHQTNNKTEKLICLFKEWFIITGRYILHAFAIILIIIVSTSSIKQLRYAFELGGGTGVGNVVFVIALFYTLFKVLQHFTSELKKDMEAFSVFFRIPSKKTVVLSGLICATLLILISIGVLAL